MASRRIIIDPSDPSTMTPEQRHAELAGIFARGVIRLFKQRHLAALAKPKNQPNSGEIGLEVIPDPCPDGPRG